MTGKSTSIGQRKALSLPVGLIAASIFAAFITLAHVPTLQDGVRQRGMIITIILATFLVILGARRFGVRPILDLALPASAVLILIISHNLMNPPLTEYAIEKRVLFPVIFLSCFLIFPLLLQLNDHSLRFTISALTLVSLIFSALAFTQSTSENIRRSSIELNPLLHAKLLFFPMFFLFANKTKSRQRLLLTAITLLAVAACLKTGSRSPLLVAFLLICLDLFVTGSRKVATRLILYAIVFSLTAAAVLSALPQEISERFSNIAAEGASEEGNRLFLFDLAVQTIQANPNGIGLGNMSDRFWIVAPHNIVLEIIMEVGFIFALPFLLILNYSAIQAIKALRSNSESHRFVSFWFLFFLGQSLIGGELTFPSMLLYVPMGLLILMRRKARQ